ncbi:toprim domain-containing protein [Campylobacter pinnipediorum]|uniref:toprim domain-containing protein n=2 Tax=Campylobacter pinnipediorum TaxID=1965231 RepID=UPI00112F96FC|nr:toprim domain-containing protein [Campylobacter pinnipediorum]
MDRMIAENKLYQDNRNNCVFVGYDMAGIPRYALRVGTNQSINLKGEVRGSDKAFASSPRCNHKSDNIAVFESVIDALSYESMNSAENLNTLALPGISSLRLEQYLKENPQTKTIILMLDNDETGINASKELASKYSEKGYNVMIHLPRKHKDWNEELVSQR